MPNDSILQTSPAQTIQALQDENKELRARLEQLEAYIERMTSDNIAQAQAQVDAQAQAAAATPQVNPEELKVLERKLAQANGQIADLTRQLSHAQQAVSDAKTDGLRKFAADVLKVADTLELMLNQTSTDTAAQDPKLKAITEGAQITLRTLQNVFNRVGIKKMDITSETVFDHDLHQAIMTVDTAEGEVADTIAEVMQSGYTIGERVLRPAMVKIRQ